MRPSTPAWRIRMSQREQNERGGRFDVCVIATNPVFSVSSFSNSPARTFAIILGRHPLDHSAMRLLRNCQGRIAPGSNG